jgi:hypothetical protein
MAVRIFNLDRRAHRASHEGQKKKKGWRKPALPP